MKVLQQVFQVVCSCLFMIKQCSFDHVQIKDIKFEYWLFSCWKKLCVLSISDCQPLQIFKAKWKTVSIYYTVVKVVILKISRTRVQLCTHVRMNEGILYVVLVWFLVINDKKAFWKVLDYSGLSIHVILHGNPLFLPFGQGRLLLRR